MDEGVTELTVTAISRRLTKGIAFADVFSAYDDVIWHGFRQQIYLKKQATTALASIFRPKRQATSAGARAVWPFCRWQATNQASCTLPCAKF